MTPEEVQKRAKALLEKLTEEHPRGCAAIHGPGTETWTVETDCNCGLREVKDFLFELAESAV
jgi:hypothetical protein